MVPAASLRVPGAPSPSWGSASGLSRLSAQSHLTGLFPLLPSLLRATLWHALPPEAGAAACFLGALSGSPHPFWRAQRMWLSVGGIPSLRAF